MPLRLTVGLNIYRHRDSSRYVPRLLVANSVQAQLNPCFFGPLGPPVDGVLLTDAFIWWRPALFSGVRLCFSCILFQINPAYFSNRGSLI
jgi:hypothetical protein